MVLVDENTWVKAGIEYCDAAPRLSCVVTNEGFSEPQRRTETVKWWNDGIFFVDVFMCIMCIIEIIYIYMCMYMWYYSIYIYTILYIDTDIEMGCLLGHLLDKSNQHDM